MLQLARPTGEFSRRVSRPWRGSDHERPWIFSLVLRVETPPIMKVKAVDQGFFDIWYMREIQNLKMIALYIINSALRKLFPVTLWVSLYVSFKSQGTLN